METPFPHPDSRRLYQPRGLAAFHQQRKRNEGRCRDPRAPSPRPPAAGQRKTRRLRPAPRSRGSRRSSAAAAGSSPAAPSRSHSPSSPRRPPPMPPATTTRRRRRRPCCSQIPSRASQHPPRRASQIRGSARTARHCSAPAPTPRRRRLGAGGRVRDASVGANGDLGRCSRCLPPPTASDASVACLQDDR